jgi:hypothetical protein
MRNKTIAVILTTVFVAGLIAGCASTKPPMEGAKVQLSGGERPSWVDNPNKESDKQNKAFTGVSRQYAMEQQARNDARLNAYIQAIDNMGVYGKRKINQVASEVGVSTDIVNPGIVQDEMTKLKSEGAAMGDVKEWHVEKWQMYEGGRWRDYYIVDCLFIMPREAVKEFMENVLKQQAAAAQVQKEKENINRALDKMKEMEASDW